MRIFNEQCNNMKKILLSLLIMVVSLPIFAQYAPGDTVTYKLSNSLPIESVTWMYNDTAFTPVKIDTAFYMQQPIYKSGYIWYQYQVTPVTKTETIVKDTLAYIHIYNKPSFTVKLNKDTVYGDEPAIAYFTYKDTLDIDNPVDSTILSLNPGLNTISFVKGNKFAKDTVTINVRMIPVLKIDKIGYYTILQDKTETYNYVKNSTSQEVNTLANRPLTLLIVSNAKDVIKAGGTVKFNWNLAGLLVPDSITVSEDSLKLVTCPEGKYNFNCIINTNKNNMAVSFNVKSDFPTNSTNLIKQVEVYCVGNTIFTTARGDLYVYNMLGQLVVKKHVEPNSQTNVPSGINVCVLNGKTYKVISK